MSRPVAKAARPQGPLTAWHANPIADEAAPALETPALAHTHITLKPSSSACPACSAMPHCLLLALRRFAQRNDICKRRRESFARQLGTMTDSGKNCSLGLEWVAWLQTQNQSGAALRAVVLCEEKDACLRSLCCCAVAKPCCGRNPCCVLRRNASHVQNDGAESAGLQDQVGYAKCLVNPRQRLGPSTRNSRRIVGW